MNVFDFVQMMEIKYGEDWTIPDLSKYEQIRYRELCDNWNYAMGYDLRQFPGNGIMTSDNGKG